MNLEYWIERPHLIWSRLRYWLWERMNPDKPWLCPGAVGYLSGKLSRSMQALEFGSGRSTIWFAQNVAHLTSIEHSHLWFRRIRAAIAESGLSNVEYRFIPLDHPEPEPERQDYDPLPAYVSVLSGFPDESMDLIVVDGHYRTTCIRACPTKLRPGGLLVVDDADMWGGPGGVPVPTGWHLVHESSNGLKISTVWQKPLAN